MIAVRCLYDFFILCYILSPYDASTIYIRCHNTILFTMPNTMHVLCQYNAVYTMPALSTYHVHTILLILCVYDAHTMSVLYHYLPSKSSYHISTSTNGTLLFHIYLQGHSYKLLDHTHRCSLQAEELSHLELLRKGSLQYKWLMYTMPILCLYNACTMPSTRHVPTADYLYIRCPYYAFTMHVWCLQQSSYYLNTMWVLCNLLAIAWPFFPFFCTLFSSSSLLTFDWALFFSSIFTLSSGWASYTNIVFHFSSFRYFSNILPNRAPSHKPSFNGRQSVMVCESF